MPRQGEGSLALSIRTHMDGYGLQPHVHQRWLPVLRGKKIWPGFNDFATRQPELAKEWHPTKNGDLKPSEIAETSHQPVWWQDPLGHEWRAQIFSRTRLHSGCPYCANRMLMPGFNDLATRFPALAEEWDEEKKTARKGMRRCYQKISGENTPAI